MSTHLNHMPHTPKHAGKLSNSSYTLNAQNQLETWEKLKQQAYEQEKLGQVMTLPRWAEEYSVWKQF